MYPPPPFIIISNNTRWTTPTTINTKTANKETTNVTQIRSPETSLEPLPQLYQKHSNANLITKVQRKPMIGPLSKDYDRDAWCVYYMDSSRHDTNCWALRYKVEDMIDNETIAVALPITQNIGTNPLPSHAAGPSAPSINMISNRGTPHRPVAAYSSHWHYGSGQSCEK